ncbi:MAG TPA: CPBP family intramembrane glutamic endopeptidase, partial [Gemmatimonadales bacterium]|nr:CPBP family intramembrane glutamic endopeptidase [Gemmatimonadales bacterium]
MVLGTALTVALGAVTVALLGEAGQSMLAGSAVALVGFGFATWFVGRKLVKLSWSDLRWRVPQAAIRGLAIGLLLGVVPAAAALLIAIPAAGAAIVPDTATPGSYLAQVGLTFVVLLPAALFEELAFRGVAQVVLAQAFGRCRALVGLSLLFALAHLANDHTTVLGITNIGLAGIFLGMAFYLPGGIWTAWG